MEPSGITIRMVPMLYHQMTRLIKSIAFGMLLMVSAVYSANGQGTVRGIITDENGETVIGATVVLKNNLSYGTVSDLDGNYSLVIKDSVPQVLVFSFVSYKTVEITVHPKNNEVVVVNVTLYSQSTDIEAVEISAKAVREKDAYMQMMKVNSATTLDYISAETIKKTGDSYVSAAVARVSGVSTTSNGFITVRGIGDRYVKTTLNGMRVPTLDPFTNNLKLDIFPTSLIDNVIITKTARTDIPGDWAGAYISVVTKDYPESLSINAETSVGYNSQSTFKDFLTSETSATDWLGYDKDFRDIDHSKFVKVDQAPTQYEELVALGLGDYYASLGINSSWQPGTSEGDTYFKLGLVQLGLLGAAQIDDPNAYANAYAAYYAGPYQNDAFKLLNESAVKSSQSLPNNWNTFYKTAPLDFSQSFSVGNQVQVFKRPLGFLAGFRYASRYRYDPNSEYNRAFRDANGVDGILSTANQQVSSESHGWSGLVNLAYKLNPNNSIAVLFMPNLTGVNKVRDAADMGFSQTYGTTYIKSQFYEQRRQLIYQLKTEHYIPKYKSKIEFSGSYTDADSKAPDFKNLYYFLSNGEEVIDVKESDTFRYYRYLSENQSDVQAAVEIPLNEKPGLSRKLKLGSAYQKNDRDYNQYNYAILYAPGGNRVIENGDIKQYFDLSTFGFQTDSAGDYYIDKTYERFDNPANHIIGYSEVIAGFVMTDYNINFRTRLTGGLRVEKANIFTDVYEYDQRGYAGDDPRRYFPGDVLIVKPGTLNEISFLPNISLVYKLRPDEDGAFNLRASFSQSVARPSIRELSDAIVYDYELQDYVFGNSDLKMVRINNYDLRLERYFKSRDNVSVSLFFKDFRDHIELVKNRQGFTWQNVDKSTVFGIELEGRKELIKNLELLANFTLVKSETDYIQYRLEVVDGQKNYVPTDTISRTMFGQAPYVINAILNYKLDSLGLSFSVSYNLQGEKLVLTSIDGIPDIYEMPNHIIDLKVSKSISKHFGASFKVQNILNEPVRRSYLYDDGHTLDYDRYTYGTMYTLSLNYKL